MKYVYPAIFYPEEDGRYSVVFPDLNDLATYGDDLPDAFAMAEEACGQYLYSLVKDKEALPAPTSIDKIVKGDDSAFINFIYVDIDEFAKKYGDHAVKKTLSIPGWLNESAVAAGINFSQTLQEALKAKLGL